MQVSRLATEILSPDALKDLEAFESAQKAKRELREQGGDAKDHAMKLVDYLEALAEDLTATLTFTPMASMRTDFVLDALGFSRGVSQL